MAHDIGAGAGIASQELANKFKKVVVSDLNKTYVEIASERLTQDFNPPKARFRFLQEPAEKSSVETGSVDPIAICEAIHWTDVQATVKEVTRQLKSGGTVAISLYTRPYILENNVADQVGTKPSTSSSKRNWIQPLARAGS